ncbi:sulfite exporter TauE/SafE family protein [bacterium]|nr:MAG: sulfite exporter TauE/SafE family protein [bacterium]
MEPTTALLLMAAIGLCAGMGSGVFGIGGGVVIVPALVFIAGFTQHRATGTSIAVLLPPIGLAAVYEYSRHGQVDWRAALIIAVMMFVGAYLGAIVANKTGEANLKLLFGVFLLMLSVYTIFGALKSRNGDLAKTKPKIIAAQIIAARPEMKTVR